MFVDDVVYAIRLPAARPVERWAFPLEGQTLTGLQALIRADVFVVEGPCVLLAGEDSFRRRRVPVPVSLVRARIVVPVASPSILKGARPQQAVELTAYHHRTHRHRRRR